ncbi:hypothetical protein SUGI_1122550 [Cryptomeria japonica]|nr:hypothetical protein SUGI_1122550 [Cryptomeria japonica]
MASNLLLFLFVVILVCFSQSEGATPQNGIQSACELAPDRKSCESSLSENPGSLLGGPKDMTHIALTMSISKAQAVRGFISRRSSMNSKQSQAVDDCLQLYDLSIDYLTEGLSVLIKSSLQWKDAVDIQSYQSAALTNQITCLDGLNEANIDLHLLSFTDHVANASRSVSNSLAIVEKLFIRAMKSSKTSVHSLTPLKLISMTAFRRGCLERTEDCFSRPQRASI